MNAEVFAEWLRRQGHRVLRTKCSYWFDASPLVYQAFPYHWLIQPDEEELAHFLWRNWAIALRYSTPIEKPLGRTSYHVVYESSTYTLDILDRRSRQNVRKGLKGCRIEQVPLSRLADEGWALEMDTVSRQGRRAKIDRARWKQRYSSASDLPGFEAWGSYCRQSSGSVDTDLQNGRLLRNDFPAVPPRLSQPSHQQCFGLYCNAGYDKSFEHPIHFLRPAVARRPAKRGRF